MSLDELVAETGRALADARRLFWPAPFIGAWPSAQGLATNRQAVAEAGQAAAAGWQGAAASTYGATNSDQLRAKACVAALTRASSVPTISAPRGQRRLAVGGIGAGQQRAVAGFVRL